MTLNSFEYQRQVPHCIHSSYFHWEDIIHVRSFIEVVSHLSRLPLESLSAEINQNSQQKPRDIPSTKWQGVTDSAGQRSQHPNVLASTGQRPQSCLIRYLEVKKSYYTITCRLIHIPLM